MDQRRQELLKQLEKAREELTDAKAAMPAHSVRPWQFQRLEDAEERLARIKAMLEEYENGNF